MPFGQDHFLYPPFSHIRIGAILSTVRPQRSRARGLCVLIADPLRRGRPCKLAREGKGDIQNTFLLQLRVEESGRDHASFRGRRRYRYLSEAPPQLTVHSKSEGNHLQYAVRSSGELLRCACPRSHLCLFSSCRTTPCLAAEKKNFWKVVS